MIQKSNQPMKGKFVLITGGTDGIGKATSVALVKQGANVVMVGRNAERGERAVAEVRSLSGVGEVSFLQADMGEMNSVRQLSKTYRSHFPQLDVLIHSAGIINMERSMTAEGIEINFAVNYLGRYLLTALLDNLLKSDARVIAMATAGVQPIRFNFAGVTEETGLSGFRAYQQSQAANDVWGIELAERLRPRGIKVAVIAPGIVKTGIRKTVNAPWWLKLFDFVAAPFALSAEKGAVTPIRLATDTEWIDDAIFFGAGLKPLKISSKAYDPATRRSLAEFSASLAPTENY